MLGAGRLLVAVGGLTTVIPTGFLGFFVVVVEAEEEEEGVGMGIGVSTVVELSFSMSARRLEVERVGLRIEGSSVVSFSSLGFSLLGEGGLLNKSWWFPCPTFIFGEVEADCGWGEGVLEEELMIGSTMTVLLGLLILLLGEKALVLTKKIN